LIRGHKIILDTDLALLYGVETKTLNRAVNRHRDRFPEDFMFRLDKVEFENLRCQIGTSSRWGGRRHLPYAFTEQGVAMLSSVLNSQRAIKVNIVIMRAFVRLREMASAHRIRSFQGWRRWDCRLQDPSSREATRPNLGLRSFRPRAKTFPLSGLRISA
jgi:hypothetical protein